METTKLSKSWCMNVLYIQRFWYPLFVETKRAFEDAICMIRLFLGSYAIFEVQLH